MRNWIQRSFRNRIFAYVLLITLLPLFLCNVLMMQFQVRRTDQDQREEAAAHLEGCREELTALAGEMEQLSAALSGSTVVRSVLRGGTTDSRILYQVLFREAGSIRESARVDVCLPSGQCCYTTAATLPLTRQRTDWGVLRAAAETEDLVFRCGGEGAFQGARAVRRYDGGILGYILFTVTQQDLDELFRDDLGSTEELLVLDPQWELSYSTRSADGAAQGQELRDRLLRGEDVTSDRAGECRYSFLRETKTGYLLALRQPLVYSRRVLDTLYFISLTLGLLCLGLCVICALWLSGNLFEPVDRLNRAMGKVEQGDLTARIETDRADELGALASTFNRMTREYRLNLERSVERQRELNAARIRMMQAQLNPHFLYNTLDSMKWLGVSHQVPQIAEMATNLADLLRYAISREEFVTLEEELELVDRYLQIQYIRYEDRFTCETDVEERFQHCLVPKLILEPLVENAIIHGVADRLDGYIKITAEDAGEDLILSVQDNGCGFSQVLMDRLNRGEGTGPGRHLGLHNVDKILSLHYGAGYGVRVYSQPGQGSRVTLRMPMRKKEEENLC